MYDNLRSICRNYAALGVQRFLVTRAIEDGAQLKLCRDIIPTANTVVCRLTASIAAMKRRVQIRELLSFAQYSDTIPDCHPERSEGSAVRGRQQLQIPRAKSGRSE